MGLDDNEQSTFSNAPDLEHFKQSALTKRELAWNALKQTRNPDYVAVRYGFPVETMRQALEKIPDNRVPQPATSRHNSAVGRNAEMLTAGDALPGITQRSRIPGEDDDLGETDADRF